MITTAATLPPPVAQPRRALAIISDSYRNGTALVEVGLMGIAADDQLAARVDAVLAQVAGRIGAPPLERGPSGSWRLWCRSECASTVRAAISLALRQVAP